MEKCKICGKETPMMQLGVRYCIKCGDSVIPVCQPCGVHPFYCKSCKARGGWQEDKDPDCIGKNGEPKARRHRDAKLRAQAKGACNVPIKKLILSTEAKTVPEIKDRGYPTSEADYRKGVQGVVEEQGATIMLRGHLFISQHIKAGTRGWASDTPSRPTSPCIECSTKCCAKETNCPIKQGTI